MSHIRLAGVIGVVMFWASLAVAGALTPGYSHITQVVSALGATGAPFAWLINGLGIIPFALGILLTGWFIVRDFRPGVLVWLSGFALIAAGAGFAVAGVFSCDVGCRPSELPSARVHNVGAGIGFLLTPLASLCLGGHLVMRSEHRGMGLFGVAMALAMLLSLAVFVGILHPERTAVGAWQRTTIAFISVWVAAMSAHLHRRSTSSVSQALRARTSKRRLTDR